MVLMNEDLLGKARSLLQAGQAVAAANAYQQVLRGNPYHAEARYELGMMYLQSNQFAQAEILFGEVLQLHPQLANVHCVRGIALANGGAGRGAAETELGVMRSSANPAPRLSEARRCDWRRSRIRCAHRRRRRAG